MDSRKFAIALLLIVASAPARADDAGKPPADARVEQQAVQAWGRDNPDCAEWSDACVVCTKAACSTPGIACTPTETACRRK